MGSETENSEQPKITVEKTAAKKTTLSSIRAASHSDIGRKREENQDSFGIVEAGEFKLYAVADGMGGVKGGAVASSLAIQVIKDAFSGLQDASSKNLIDALLAANQSIFQESMNSPGLSGMGTTFVGLLFRQNELFVANVGDSRAYRIRSGEVVQLSEDHTLVMELLRSGTISAEQAENHPVSHMLTRSLGPQPDVEIDCRKLEEPKEGDQYVLCSDGLYNLVTNYEIAEVLGSHPIERGVEVLIDLANERGGSDNITVIAVRVGEELSVFERIRADSTGQRRSAVDGLPVDANFKVRLDGVVEASKLVSSDGEAASGSDTVNLEDVERLANTIKLKTLIEEAEGDEGDNREQSKTKSSTVKPRKVTVTVERSPFGYLLVMVAVVICSIGAAMVMGRHREEDPQGNALEALGGSQEDAHATPPSPVLETILARSSPALTSAVPVSGRGLGEDSDLHQQIPLLIDNSRDTDSQSSVGRLPVPNINSRLNPEQRSRVEQRIDALKSKVADLTAKIESFDRPVSGEIAKTMRDAQERGERLKVLLEEVKKSIELATRKLAIWYQRRKQFHDEGDPLNLAATVALVSDGVKRRHDGFKEVSAQYIKEQEALNFNPTDQAQRSKVAELIAQRKQSLGELSDEIQVAIENEISKADQHIAEFALQRDRVELSLERALTDVEYAKIVMSNDRGAKQRMRDIFIRERESAQQELETLSKMVPLDALHILDSSTGSAGLTPDNNRDLR